MSDTKDAVAREKEIMREAHQKGGLAVPLAFIKCSGPGWLQGAITLGGGSLAGSLYLGVLGGYSLLWLQVIAMIMGVVMLSAITYVTLSTGKRPFQAINEHVNPVLGWGWALATLMANIVWCLPQFALGSAAVKQNLIPSLNNFQGTVIACCVILAIAVVIIWFYDSGGNGVKLFERLLQLMVFSIMLCFIGVVFKLAGSEQGLPWDKIWKGFIPNLALLKEPAETFGPALAATGEFAGFWKGLIVGQQRDVMITAAATAVGINMTFLLPYSMLKKGWDKESRGLAIFDLSTGLFIPFVFATTCVVVAAASQFHAQPELGALDGTNAKLSGQAEGFLKKRLAKELGAEEYARLEALTALGAAAGSEVAGLSDAQQKAAAELAPLGGSLKDKLAALPEADRRMAAMLVKRDAFNLAASLEKLTGKTFSHYIFGFGVLGMALSTIIILMLISGFTICEIFGLPHRGMPHRIGCLIAGLGVFGPFIWSGKTQFWLAVPTSVFGMALLPIAYLSFFLLMNNKKVMGDERLTGGKGFIVNLLMLVALGAATFGAGYAIWSKIRWVGVGLVGAIVVLAFFVHLVRKTKAELAGDSGSSSDNGSAAGAGAVGVTACAAAPQASEPAETLLLRPEDFKKPEAAGEQGETLLLTPDHFKNDAPEAAPAAGEMGETVLLRPEDFKKSAVGKPVLNPVVKAASKADAGYHDTSVLTGLILV